MHLATNNNLLLVLYDAQNRIFSMNSRSSVSWKPNQTLFSTLHHLSLVIFATATLAAFVLLGNSRFNFHCYTQREEHLLRNQPGSDSCDLLWLLVRKIMKGIHLCKPALLNCPIDLRLKAEHSKATLAAQQHHTHLPACKPICPLPSGAS